MVQHLSAVAGRNILNISCALENLAMIQEIYFDSINVECRCVRLFLILFRWPASDLNLRDSLVKPTAL